jgi:hypothetical protein
MATPARKIFLTVWRDTTVAIALTYFGLLSIDAVFDQLVRALVPINAIGWLAGGMVLIWVWLARSTKTKFSAKL